jgi:hypothetical protein
MPGRTTRPRRPARSREVTRFIAATLIAVDLLLTGFTFWDLAASLRTGLLSFLEAWDVGKGATALIALAFISFRVRSPSLGVFAAILGVITMLERTGAHGRVARWILRNFDLSTAALDGVDRLALVELLLLSSIAVVAAVVIWFSRRKERDLSFVRRDLLLLLAALWIFAVGVDYVSSFTGSSVWRFIEETGERVVMSILLGYIFGIRLRRHHADRGNLLS